MKTRVVLCTVPTQQTATIIARRIVGKHFAACVNVLPNVTSYYEWDKKLCVDEEFLLVIKTTDDRIKELFDCITGVHPYAVPELIALEISEGSEKYLSWIQTQCGE